MDDERSFVKIDGSQERHGHRQRFQMSTPARVGDVVSSRPGVLECAWSAYPTKSPGEAIKPLVVDKRSGVDETQAIATTAARQSDRLPSVRATSSFARRSAKDSRRQRSCARSVTRRPRFSSCPSDEFTGALGAPFMPVFSLPCLCGRGKTPHRYPSPTRSKQNVLADVGQVFL